MFEWKEEYSVKIVDIDEEHKQLLKIGNEVESLLISDNVDKYEEIVRLVEKLVDYTQYHFQTEEFLLEKYKYPDIKLHKKEHEKFIQYLKSLNLEETREVGDQTIKELLLFIAKWLIRHLADMDKQYSTFLVHAMQE